METAWYLEILEHEGRSLADAAEQAGPDAPIPACPDWQVRDLLRHTGVVHRWAAGFVADACPTPRPMEEHPDLDGEELVAWYRACHRALLDTLHEAKPDVECWTFCRAPSPARLLGPPPGP